MPEETQRQLTRSKPATQAGDRSATAKKTAATVLRHKEERRAEILRPHPVPDRRRQSGRSPHVRRRAGGGFRGRAHDAVRATRPAPAVIDRPTTGRRRTARRLYSSAPASRRRWRARRSSPQRSNAPSGSSSAGRAAAGVRLKRGAGPGWRAPPTSTNVPRAVMWGCSGASQTPRTTVAHASSPSSSPPHSPAVRAAKTSVRRCLNSGQRSRSNCGICSAGTPSSSSRRA